MLATLAVYWPVRHFEFLNYDDDDGIVKSAMVRQGLSWRGVAYAFQNQHMGNWQPATTLSHMFDCQLFRLRPGPPHLHNLALHLANTLLLFFALQRFTGARWRSAFVAALFALHPLHVESVAWVSERKDVLSTFFLMLTLLAYTAYVKRTKGGTSNVQRPTSNVEPGGAAVGFGSKLDVGRWTLDVRLWGPRAWYVCALVFFTLGLMSKPMLVTVPFLLLLLDFWPLNRVQSPKFKVQSPEPKVQSPKSKVQSQRPDAGGQAPAVSNPEPESRIQNRASRIGIPPAQLSRLVLEKVPFLALAVAMSWITLVSQERAGAMATLSVIPIQSRLANIPVSYVRYIQKMLWPEGLVPYYPQILNGPGIPRMLQAGGQSVLAYYPRVIEWAGWQVAGAAVLLAAVSGGVVWARRRRPYLCVGWFWFVLTLVPVIGFVQVGMQAMADRYTYIPLIGLFVMGVWGLAETSNFKLQTSEKLQTSNLNAAQTPSGPGAYSRLGVWTFGAAALLACMFLTHRQVQYWRDSISLFKHELMFYPGVALAHNNVGAALYDRAEYQEAIPYLREALRLKPDYPTAHNNLGLSFWRLGQDEKALEEFDAVLSHQPDVKAFYNKGVVLFQQNKLDEAKACFIQALELQPDLAEAHNNLGNLLALAGKRDEAAEQFAAAVRYAPDLVEAHCNLARYFTETGAVNRAIESYSSALRAQPRCLQAHSGLAGIFEQTGNLPEAARHYAAVVQLQPDLAEAHNNLSNLAGKLNDPEQALVHGLEAVRLKPDWAEAHFNLANAQFLQNKLDDALVHYQTALRLKTNYFEARQNFGYALEKLGRYQDAAEQYGQLVQTRPDFAAAFDRLAAVLAKLGRFDEAIKAAEQGLKLATAAGQQSLAQQISTSLETYRTGTNKTANKR